MSLKFITANHKIKVSMKDFILTGKFDYLKIGQTKSEITSLLPEPDDFFPDTNLQEAEIWRYGKIALHFDFNDHQTLEMIFTSNVRKLDGGRHLSLDNWILDTPVTLLQFQRELNSHFMSYEVRVSAILNYVKIYLKHDICLMFCPANEITENSKDNEYNEFTLEAISLTPEGSIFDDRASYN